MPKVQESLLGSEAPRFWSKVEVGRGSLLDGPKSQCWMWRGDKDQDGYGVFCVGGTTVKAHRFSYTWHSGTDPHPLHVLHRCNNPSCVNPLHLYAGTNQQNMDDRKASGGYSTPSHCPAGHPYTGVNAYRYKLKHSPGYGTHCRKCKALRQREYVARQRHRLEEMGRTVRAVPPAA